MAFCAVPGSPPSEADYQTFERSWVTRAMVDACHVRRVDDVEGKLLVGCKSRSGNHAGWFVPYRLPGDPSVRGYRLRRDEPDMVYKSNFEVKEGSKYLSAFGDRVKLYFPAGTLPEWLNDAAMKTLICEGEKKSMALHLLAEWQAAAPRWLTIGLAGVWGFRGKIGKTVTASGKDKEVRGPIPDLDHINWVGREVLILFDSDVNSNSEVARARVILSQELLRRGARVRWVDIPAQGVTV
jgi:hypothetical protein